MFGISLGKLGQVSGGLRFSPAALFPSGTAGAWYDPSDSTTLFSDTAGTTPSPTPGGGALSVVGLMLDKSQGLALGSELMTNGGFSSGTTGWTAGNANNTLSNDAGRGKCVSSVANGAFFGQSFSAVAGTTYKFVWSGISDGTSVAPAAVLGTAPLGTSNRLTETQTGGYGFGTNRTFYYTATATETLWFWFYGGAAAPAGNYILIDNVSVQSIAGNHAISYNTTTARPELSARVNLLTYSEQFDNAAWTKSNAAAAIITTTPDPLGGTTAREVTAIAGTGVHGLYQLVANSAIGAGVSATFSAYFRYVNNRYLRFAFVTGGGNQSVYVDIDLLNGVIVNTGPYSTATQTAQSIVSVGNGWYRVSVTGTLPSATNYATAYFRDSSSNANPESAFSFTASGTEKFLIWGADLRPANIGTSVPAYQRIADQYTYDSNGFPRYLVFNGTASGMYTPANLNLSGTAQATVFAGVRKQADPTDAMLAEFSSVFTNAGSFAVAAPWTSTTLRSYFVAVNGNAINSRGYTGYAAPISNVLSAAIKTTAADSDAAQDVRINAADVAGSSIQSAASTGNFGTYPLYIGSRNNGSLWFNGYLYSLIVVGAASTAAQISSTESWINVKEGGVY